MTERAISADPALLGADLADGDLFPVVDISAADADKNKHMLASEARLGLITAAAVAAALAAAHLELPALGSTAPGTYTLANSGMVWKNASGVEIFRAWATDPDTGNYNCLNLYLGQKAGFSQTTNNVDSGYSNVGVGPIALYNNTIGYHNTAFGKESLWANTEGSSNTGLGIGALLYNTIGSDNIGIGYCGLSEEDTDPTLRSVMDTDMIFIGNYATRGGTANTNPMTNGIAIGYGAVVDESNKAVLGNASVTKTVLRGDVTVTGTSRVFATGASHTVDELVTLLQTIGLCKQS